MALRKARAITKYDDYSTGVRVTSVPVESPRAVCLIAGFNAKTDAMKKWTIVPKDKQSPDREYSIIGRDMSEVTAEEAKGDWCPGCGSDDYHHVEGCKICNSCGYSPCH